MERTEEDLGYPCPRCGAGKGEPCQAMEDDPKEFDGRSEIHAERGASITVVD